MGEDIKSSNPFSIIDALIVISVILIYSFFLPIEEMSWFLGLGSIICPSKPILGVVFLSALLQGIIFVALVLAIVKLKYKQSWAAIGLHKDLDRHWLMLGLGQGVLLFFIVTIVGIIMSSIYPYEVKPQAFASVINSVSNWREALLLIVIGSVIAPISEEIYFRGFLYTALKGKTGKTAAIIISASFFGLLHFDLLRFIPITLGGIWLTYIYEKTGSLLTSMLAHSVWNSIMTALILVGTLLMQS